MRYSITGNTFPIKDSLKSCGCTWNPEKREWKTVYMEENSPLLAKIRTICRYENIQILPEKLSEECEKIQKILNRID